MTAARLLTAWMAVLVCGPLPAGAVPDSASTPREPASPRFTIRWNWTGEPVVYELERTTTDIIPVPGKDPVVERTIVRVVRHRGLPDPVEPEDRAPADATPVRLTWEAIRLDQADSLNTPLSYDSSVEHHWTRTAHPLIGNAAASLGQSVTLEIAPDGSVAGVRDLEGFLRGVERNLTKWNLANETTYERLQAVYTPAALARSGAGTYAFLPAEPLAVGEAYTVSRPVTLEHVGTLETAETHTLESVDRDGDGRRLARFRISGTVRWPDPGGVRSEMFNVSLDKAVVSGAWSFDLDRGKVTEYALDASLLSDIVRYDPRDRSSSEMSTEQRLRDRMRLAPPPDASDAGAP
jgi:hypothetical protein